MPWTRPAGVTPIDRKPPSAPTRADIPAVLDWLRDFYGGHTVVGLLITDRATGTTYRVDAEPAYRTAGTLDNYTLTPFGDSGAAQAAAQAQADAQAAKDIADAAKTSAADAQTDATLALAHLAPILESGGYLVMPRLDGTARLLYGENLTATDGTYTLRGVPLKTITLTEAP